MASADEGIWEVRGGRQHFTHHSKVMAWVAFLIAQQPWLQRRRRRRDRRAAGAPSPTQFRPADVCAKAYDADLGSFVQAYGSKTIDASVLQIPLVGFLPADDPRVVGTVAAVEKWLMRDGLVLRYRTELTDDGLPPGEGAFLAWQLLARGCHGPAAAI